MQDKALMTVVSRDGPPTFEVAAEQLGVHVDAVDQNFGVVLIDPGQGLWHLSCRFSAESKPDVIVEPVVITDPRNQIGPVGRLQQLPTDVPRAQRSMEPNK